MEEIEIKQDRPRIEALLEPYKDVIGGDYAGYRNHVYRKILNPKLTAFSLRCIKRIQTRGVAA